MTRPLRALRPVRGGLRQLAPMSPRRRLPWWVLLVLALLAGLLAWTLLGPDEPESLVDSRLTGPRSPVPLSVVVLADESGSFTKYRQVREQVLAQLVDWAPENLRADDTITVISFAGSAELKMATTTVAALRNGSPVLADPSLADDTLIQPAVERAAQEVGDAGRPVALIAVTDTLVLDAEKTQVDDLIKDLGAVSMSVILPDGVNVTGSWQKTFPWEREFRADPGSVDESSVAIGEALAHATGQELEAR